MLRPSAISGSTSRPPSEERAPMSKRAKIGLPSMGDSPGRGGVA